MTRDDFEEISYLGELLDFCYEVDCDILDNIGTDISDRIEEQISEAVRHLSWRTIRDRLNDINADYLEYFIEGDDWLEFYDAEENFDDYKDQVREWCEDNEVFDPEDEEEEPDDGSYDNDGSTAEPSEVFDTTGLFEMIDTSIVDVSALMEKSRLEAAAAEEANARAVKEMLEAAEIERAAASARDAATAEIIISGLVF